MKTNRQNLIAIILVASVAIIACGPGSPANNNNNRRAANANEAQSNASQSNSSPSKPSTQAITNTKGSIEVTSVPSGAKVLLVANDEAGAGEPQSRGLTPTTIAGLQPGKYTVDLEKPGYKFFQKEVVVKQGAIAKVNATLRKQ